MEGSDTLFRSLAHGHRAASPRRWDVGYETPQQAPRQQMPGKQGVRLEDNLSGPWTDSPGLAWMGSEDLEFGPGSGSPGSAESLGNQGRPVVTPENSRSLEEAYTYDANTMITTES